MGLFTALVGGALSLFGANKQAKDQKAAEYERFPRLRASAEAAGFNPLTALLANGGSGFGEATGTAPLASAQILRGMVSDVGDHFAQKKSVKAAQDYAHRRVGQINSERASAGRAGAIAARTVRAASQTKVTPKIGLGGGSPWLAAGHGSEKITPADSAGIFNVSNDLTGGNVSLPGDTEPWGIDELVTAVVAGGPQVIYNWGKKAYELAKEHPEKIDAAVQKYTVPYWVGREVTPRIKAAGERFNTRPNLDMSNPKNRK